MSGPDQGILQFPAGVANFDAIPLRVAMVGNYPPRRCGIATFTADTVEALRSAAPKVEYDIYAMTADRDCRPCPGVTRLVFDGERDSHRQAGIAIDGSGADVVWLQHEFGIFGGESGDMVIDLLEPIASPLVVTLHTVRENPTPDQERVMAWLAAHASRLVVMSQSAARILQRRKDVRPGQVVVIEHGAPDRPHDRSAAMKQTLGLGNGPVLLTFGLISRGKGIESAIRALAHARPRHCDACYVIAGATHPNLVRCEGEAYRDELKELARSLGVERNIRWIDEFLGTEELLDLIEAADIYLTPYTGAEQSTSGTLTYAVALGKAVISTPYNHAADLLGGGHGILVPFNDASAMGEAICGLLDDPAKLRDLRQKAYLRGRTMTWPQVARRALRVIEQVVHREPVARPQAPVTHDDLERLCDGTGILQHSVLGVPDRQHGYCVDDNARALMFCNRASGTFFRHATTFAAFVQHSWNPQLRRFRNFMHYDRSWCEEAGSEDSNGRTLWALGATAADAPHADLRGWAENLWRVTADIALHFHSPRAMAFAMLGADRLLDAHPDDANASAILQAGTRALANGLAAHSRDGRRWFEATLAYDNCRLAEALLAGAHRRGDQALASAALEALEWVVTQQTAPGGHYRPVGSSGFGRELPAFAPFDQQPVDAWATVDAAARAWRLTGQPQWRDLADRAFGWFFGANDRGIALADVLSGACMDGLTPLGPNLNRGAESVLSLHLAAQTWQDLQIERGQADQAALGRLLPLHSS